MRTILEFRDYLLGDLDETLKRPIAAGGTAWGIFVCLRNVLSELCFIDERESDWKVVKEEYLCGPQGIVGQFECQRLFATDFVNEVASVFAEVAFHMNYFRPSRLLDRREWNELKDSLTPSFFSRDWGESELHERFGRPSYECGGAETDVSCYASEDRSCRWIFFDFYRKDPRKLFDPNAIDNWFDSPRLRNVRWKDNKFILVPFGRSLAMSSESPR